MSGGNNPVAGAGGAAIPLQTMTNPAVDSGYAANSAPQMQQLSESVVGPALQSMLQGLAQREDVQKQLQPHECKQLASFQMTPEIQGQVTGAVQAANASAFNKTAKTPGLSGMLSGVANTTIDTVVNQVDAEQLVRTVGGVFGDNFNVDLIDMILKVMSTALKVLKPIMKQLINVLAPIVGMVVKLAIKIILPIIIEAVCDCVGLVGVGSALGTMLSGPIGKVLGDFVTKGIKTVGPAVLDVGEHVLEKASEFVGDIKDAQATVALEKQQAQMQQMIKQGVADGTIALEPSTAPTIQTPKPPSGSPPTAAAA